MHVNDSGSRTAFANKTPYEGTREKEKKKKKNVLEGFVNKPLDTHAFIYMSNSPRPLFFSSFTYSRKGMIAILAGYARGGFLEIMRSFPLTNSIPQKGYLLRLKAQQ